MIHPANGVHGLPDRRLALGDLEPGSVRVFGKSPHALGRFQKRGADLLDRNRCFLGPAVLDLGALRGMAHLSGEEVGGPGEEFGNLVSLPGDAVDPAVLFQDQRSCRLISVRT